MRELRWSDFEWFKKNSKVNLDTNYLKCSESKDKDQKLIFPLKQLGKHLTFALSDRYLDLHATNDDRSVSPRNIMEIRLGRAKKIINKESQMRQPISFIPFHDKSLNKLFLVDPRSKQFLKIIHKMNGLDLLPRDLLQMRSFTTNRHNKILFVYHMSGKFKGIVKCNHNRHGFEYVISEIMYDLQNKLVNLTEIKKKLLDEGLKENLRYKMTWERWYRMIGFFDKVFGRIIQFRDLISKTK